MDVTHHIPANRQARLFLTFLNAQSMQRLSNRTECLHSLRITQVDILREGSIILFLGPSTRITHPRRSVTAWRMAHHRLILLKCHQALNRGASHILCTQHRLLLHLQRLHTQPGSNRLLTPARWPTKPTAQSISTMPRNYTTPTQRTMQAAAWLEWAA